MALLRKVYGNSLRAKDAVKVVRHVRRELQQRGGGGDQIDMQAWENALVATEPYLSEDVTRDKFAVKGMKKYGIPASTAVSKVRGITVTYDISDDELPPIPSDEEYANYLEFLASASADGAESDEDMEELVEDIDTRIGALTSTFVHEIIVHGNYAGLDPDDEHDSMHAPELRDRYLAASMSAVALLRNDTQKEAFADAWEQDLNDQLDEYEDRNAKDPDRRAWIEAQRELLFPSSDDDDDT